MVRNIFQYCQYHDEKAHYDDLQFVIKLSTLRLHSMHSIIVIKTRVEYYVMRNTEIYMYVSNRKLLNAIKLLN